MKKNYVRNPNQGKGKVKFIVILLVLILIVIGVLAIGKYISVNNNKNSESQTTSTKVGENEKMLSDGTKINTSLALNADKKFDKYTIKNIRLTEKDNMTRLLATVSNNTENENLESKLVDVILLDKDGNEIRKIGGIIASLKAGESTQLNVNITADLTNAYDFKIVVK